MIGSTVKMAFVDQHRDALSDDKFVELQEKGQCYAESYLRPVTEEALSIFWEN